MPSVHECNDSPTSGKLTTMLRRELFLLLVVVLSFVPVFQAAHMLTHVAPADMTGMTQADGNLHEDLHEGESDADAGVDKICLDCLALTFSVILPFLLACLFDQTRRRPLTYLKSRHCLLDFSPAYLTRAPPQA